jgi:hypothetical protein
MFRHGPYLAFDVPRDLDARPAHRQPPGSCRSPCSDVGHFCRWARESARPVKCRLRIPRLERPPLPPRGGQSTASGRLALTKSSTDSGLHARLSSSGNVQGQLSPTRFCQRKHRPRPSRPRRCRRHHHHPCNVWSDRRPVASREGRMGRSRWRGRINVDLQAICAARDQAASVLNARRALSPPPPARPQMRAAGCRPFPRAGHRSGQAGAYLRSVASQRALQTPTTNI